MPADSSIYSLIRPQAQGPGPMQNMAQTIQLRALLDDQDLKRLQREQIERGFAEERDTADAYRNAAGDPAKAREELYRRGLYKPGMALDKNIADTRKTDAETAVKRMEAISKGAALLKERLPTVRDEASYRAYADSAVSLLGPDMARQLNLPQAYDPTWVRNQVVKAEELFTPKPQEMDLGGRRQVVDMNPWTNPAIVGQQFAKTMTPDAQANALTVPDASGTFRPNQPVISAKQSIAAAGKPNMTTNILPPQKTFDNEDKLRNDYTSNPKVKASAEMDSAFRMIEAAYKNPTAANDLAMATKYMKILDPTSVVRESEFALAVNATGLLDKVQNYAASVIEGKKLNPAQRKDFYESAKAINDSFQAGRAEVDNEYAEMATGYGLNPKNVIPSLRTPKKDGAPKPPKPTSFDAPPDPSKHKGRRMRDENGIEYRSDGKEWKRL